METELHQVYAADRRKWRDWLIENHESRDEAWLVRYKVHTGRPGISYEDAVEEALCFGWIDGRVRRIDDERYMIRFTPRRSGSRWSALNIGRAEKMIEEGLMTDAGLAEIKSARKDGRWERAFKDDKNRKKEIDMPEDLAGAMKKNREALENFEQMAPSYRRNYIRWVEAARKSDTRQRRIDEVVQRAARNIKPGI